ncbi:MAG TPA: AAA family ATPase, partial [Trebonia sp.]|nr:AAA family ATPase [Trebonia sp.]
MREVIEEAGHGPAATVSPEPFYLPAGDEVEVFRAAYARRIPVLLKGPTGSGKTRFVEHMAWHTARDNHRDPATALVTVSCHDDLTSADLVGRYLLSAEGTTWLDGPLTRAVRDGSLCYLDEIVEARKDTTVILHALTDHRRNLPVERLSATIPAHPDFLLVISYNPGYQAAAKDLKPSTRQRFMAIEFTYPAPHHEAQIITHETGTNPATAQQLA